ncbi:MAG: hypothetical protein RL042_2155 [Nitrospirota bacterium]|jgi:hypothetical protein
MDNVPVPRPPNVTNFIVVTSNLLFLITLRAAWGIPAGNGYRLSEREGRILTRDHIAEIFIRANALHLQNHNAPFHHIGWSECFPCLLDSVVQLQGRGEVV